MIFDANLLIMAEVYILLGGNVGDKSKIFKETRKLIDERIGLIIKLSSIYESEPWGFESDLFWNQAIIVETSLNPHDILHLTQSIEKKMGRTKISDHYESRIIDIDILFYNDLELNSSKLILPHPKMGERNFVLIPLTEIAPEKIHPVIRLKVKEMLQICRDRLKVEKID